MDQLIQFDRHLFYVINNSHNAFFDAVMPLLRSSQFWVPLYLFLLFFALFNFNRNVWWWAIAAGITATLADYVSSDIIKENIWRLRPCNDPELAHQMRFLLNYRPQSSSFTSSHAVNHFAMGTFFFLTLRKHIGKWAWFFFFWAFIIIYAQVYVGVHFPLDVICGGLIGIILGYLTAGLFNKKFPLA